MTEILFARKTDLDTIVAGALRYDIAQTLSIAQVVQVFSNLSLTPVIAGSILAANGVGALPIWTAAPSLTTSLTVPLVIGGTAVGSDLILQSTSGVGDGTDTVIIKRGNNGATTVATFGTSIAFGVNVTPAANDGAALGTAALMWSDAFFASGGVINWNAGDLTLTHTAGTLTSNGDFRAARVFSQGANSALIAVSRSGGVSFAWYSATGATLDLDNATGSVVTFASGALSAGKMAVLYTTASTNATTGALTVAGGLGVVGRINAGSTIGVVVSADIMSATFQQTLATAYAQFQFQNDLGVVQFGLGGSTSTFPDRFFLYAGAGGGGFNGEIWGVSRTTGVMSVNATTASTSTTTGALKIAGGLGVVGAVNVGTVLSALSGVIIGAVSGSLGTTVSLQFAGTVSNGANVFGVYMGTMTLAPNSGGSAFFQYVGGGTVNTGGNTIDTVYGLFSEAIVKAGGGTITNLYAGYFVTSSSATNNYGIYVAGPSSFGVFPASLTTNLVVAASTTAKSSMRIPSGTAPTSPVIGDFWYEASGATGLKFRDSGGTTRTITMV